MKRFPIAVLMGLLLVSPGVFADEADKYDWLLRDDIWFMSPDDINIDWNDHPLAEFRKFTLPEGTPLYRGLSVFGLFRYYYPVGTEQIVQIGWDENKDGEDDVLKVTSRNNFSEMFFGVAGGGTRRGEIRNADHPIVGEWLDRDGDLWQDVRLVEPADYRYFLHLNPGARLFSGFEYTRGWYLLKYLGNGIFESEGSFSEGRIRLEVKKAGYILLTPISDKSAEEEPRKPMRMHAETSKIPLTLFEKYGSEELPKAAVPPAVPVIEQPAEPIAPAQEEQAAPKVLEEDPAGTPEKAAKTVQPGINIAVAVGVAVGIAGITAVAAAIFLLRKRRKEA